MLISRMMAAWCIETPILGVELEDMTNTTPNVPRVVLRLLHTVQDYEELSDETILSVANENVLSPEFNEHREYISESISAIPDRVRPKLAALEDDAKERNRQWIDADNAYNKSKKWVTYPSGIVISGLILLALASIVDAFAPSGRIVNLFDYSSFMNSTPRDAALGIFLIVVAAGSYAIMRSTRKELSVRSGRNLASQNSHSARQTLFRRLESEVDTELREIASERVAMLQGRLKVPPIAPGLVEADDQDFSDTKTITTLRAFIARSRTSAVALAGARGIGKSSTIRTLTADCELFDVAVVIPAPVRYDADSMLRRIRRDLAMQILDQEGATGTLEKIATSEARMLDLGKRRQVMLSFVAGVALILFTTILRAGAIDLGIGGVAGFGFIFYSASMAVGQVGRRVGVRNTNRVNNAIAEIQHLDYSTEVTADSKITTGLDSLMFGSEESASKSRRARDLERVEHIEELRRFVMKDTAARREAGDSNPLPVAIAIDELDKLSSSESVLEVINSIKDLFRLNGVHFIVSVSDEALESFNLRSVGRRDAFDSAFDEIVRVEPLTLDQARSVIGSRTIGFPEPLVAVCYAISGGLPREMIRLARRVVALSVELGESELEKIASVLVHQECTNLMRTIARGAEGLCLNDSALAEHVFLRLKYAAHIRYPDELRSLLMESSAQLVPAKSPLMLLARNQLDIGSLVVGVVAGWVPEGDDGYGTWEALVKSICGLSSPEGWTASERELLLTQARGLQQDSLEPD